MDVKTFRANTLQEALQLVRRQLGPDAAVLRTREVRGGLTGWLLNKAQIEVAATRKVAVSQSVTVAVPSPPPLIATRRVKPDESGLDLAAMGATRTPSAAPSLAAQGRQVSSSTSVALQSPAFNQPAVSQSMDAELKHGISRHLVGAVGGEQLDWLCEMLRQHWPSSAGNCEDISTEVLRQAIANALPVHAPPKLRPGAAARWAFVGPTGVGKTTTIAKLAADLSLRQCLRVGLITTDTFRVAAIEQLRAYAEMMAIPLEVVSQADEVAAALARLHDCDVVLIDTAGTTGSEADKLAEVRQVLRAAQCGEVFAVLNASGEASWLERSIRQLKNLGATSLVLSKLDDVTQSVRLLPLLLAGELPISFAACGQQVPDDLLAADPHDLARRLLAHTDKAAETLAEIHS